MNEELLHRVARMGAELKAGRRRNRRLALVAATMAAVYVVAQWGPAVYAAIADSLFFYTKNGSGTDTARLVIPTDNVVADGNNVTMRVETSVNGSTNLQVDATSNQLLLGGGNGGSTSATTTVSATTPAVSVIYTIPDAGGAANVILSTTSAGTAQSLTTGTTGSMTIDTGTSGTVNLGTGSTAKTVNLGTGTGGDTINIGTGSGTNTLAIGNGTGAGAPTSTTNINGRVRVPIYTTEPATGGAAAGEIFFNNNAITATTSGTENLTSRFRAYDPGSATYRNLGATLLLFDNETLALSIGTANNWTIAIATGATSVTTSAPGLYVATIAIYQFDPIQNLADNAWRILDQPPPFPAPGTTRANIGFRPNDQGGDQAGGSTITLFYEKTTTTSETLQIQVATTTAGLFTRPGPTVAGAVQNGYSVTLVRYGR